MITCDIPMTHPSDKRYIYLHENHKKSTIHGSVHIPFVPWMICCNQRRLFDETLGAAEILKGVSLPIFSP